MAKVKIAKRQKPHETNTVVNSYLYDLNGITESILLMKQIHIDMQNEFPYNPNQSYIDKLFSDYNTISQTFIEIHSTMTDEMINNYIDSLHAIHCNLLKTVPKGKKHNCISKNGKEIKSNYHQRIDGALTPLTSHRIINEKSLTPIMRCTVYSFLAIVFALLPIVLNTSLSKLHPLIGIIVILVCELIFAFSGTKSCLSYFKIKQVLTIYKRSDINSLLSSISIFVAILAIMLNLIFSFLLSINKSS